MTTTIKAEGTLAEKMQALAGYMREVDTITDAQVNGKRAAPTAIVAELVLRTAERDAAVRRNIELQAAMQEERAQRIPVADTILSVYGIIDAKIAGTLAHDNSHARSVEKALEEVRHEVEDLPGWDGTEGGFYPGMMTTHFVARDVAVEVANTAETFVSSVTDDLGAQKANVCARTVGALTELRRAIAKVRP